MFTSKEEEQKWLETTFDRLWPICRSLMGPGFRESLAIFKESIPLEELRFKSGQSVFDWQVPLEWRPRAGYFLDPQGRRHADFSQNNLHLLGYSVPFRGKISRSELDQHLYSLPDQPDAIPYLTSYYRERWGFCISQRERDALPAGEYEVVVDTELVPGELCVGEVVLPGVSKHEVLFSTYLCHPSLANNELSGPLAVALLYHRLRQRTNRHWTYRFVFSAETLGTLCYLSERGEHLKNQLVAGYQVTCVGDAGPFTYKRTKHRESLTDWAALKALASENFRLVEFDPADGSDERQYCSPGFDLPVGSLMRTMYAQYPEYHTSLDNRSLIHFQSLQATVDLYVSMIDRLESNPIYLNQIRNGEPQLGKRGLYPTLGGQKEIQDQVRAMMWLLSFSDGRHGIDQIAEKSGMRRKVLETTADALCKAELLKAI